MADLRSSRPRALVGAVLLLGLAACGAQPLAEALSPLPKASDARPYPGCTIVSVAEVEALPRGPGGPGAEGPRRALLRHTADCLPDAPGATQSYRIQFVQEFSESQGKPGPGLHWNGGEPRFDESLDTERRTVEADREGVGKNCAALLKRVEQETIPCVQAMDMATGNQLHEVLGRFRAQNSFPMNVMGDNHLQVVVMGRDAHCLAHWEQVKGLMETRFAACWED